MMRNNLLNFAEFERETIAARVTDAYNTRATETGFYQGGKRYYGFDSERRTINGKVGSVLVPNDKADVVKKAFEIYEVPSMSLADVMNYFVDNGININSSDKSNMDRSHLSRILCSPLYVCADKNVYQYLVSQGVEIIDDVEAFDGVHGLFRHSRKSAADYVKVGYHDGLVDSDMWLAVQDKKSHNKKIPRNGTAKNSWLTGIVKCGYCGYSPVIIYSWNTAKTIQWRYYNDSGHIVPTVVRRNVFKLDPMMWKMPSTKP
jgi:hypothetical protein